MVMSSDSPREPMPRKVVEPHPGFPIPNSGLLNEAYCFGGNVETKRCQDMSDGGAWLQTLARGDRVGGWKVSEDEAGWLAFDRK